MTMEFLRNSPIFTNVDEWKGKFTFYFKDNKKTALQITTTGKLSITFPEKEEYQDFLNRVKPFLLTKDKTPAEVEKIIKKLPETIKNVLKEREADPEKVLGFINALKMEKDPDILQFDINNLNNLAGSQRIAHIPVVLPFLEKALKDSKYQDSEILKGLIHLVELMLAFERRSPSPKQNLIDRIQNNILSSILQISESVTDEEVLRRIIYCLKNTDRKESVDAIFNIVERVNEDLYNILKSSVFEVFFTLSSSLENNQKKRINKNIRKLIKNPDPKIRERGKELADHSR